MPFNYLILMVFLLIAGPETALAEPLRLTRLQLGLNAGLTRLVVEASAPPDATLAAASDGLGLQLSLPAARWAAAAPGITASGLVAALGLPVAGPDGTLGIAIDLVEPAV